MKTLIALFFVLGSLTASAQETGKVYLIRPYNYFASMASFKCFMDDTTLCNINNTRYSIHDVKAGTHTFSVQQKGKEKKNDAFTIPLNIEAGKTYYLQIVIAKGLIFQEMNEVSANAILPSLKQDTDCD